ncbi:MAG: hypothetical protein Q8L69_15690 [Gallionellaceae bacterium]|nr:hypothetical protein [Gallionellaceae bacterium]
MNLPTRISLLAALLTGAAASGADELGRVFFTPEQRAGLEHKKLQGEHPGNSSRTLAVNGIVQRHGGERTVWINGVPQPADKSDERSPDSVSIAITGQPKQTRVKVGQKVIINPAASEQ